MNKWSGCRCTRRTSASRSLHPLNAPSGVIVHCIKVGVQSHLRTLILIRCQRPFICSKVPENKGFPANRRFQTEVPAAGFFCFSPVATRVFLHDSSRLPCKFKRFWPENVYLYTILCLPCKNTRFPLRVKHHRSTALSPLNSLSIYSVI